ncbi:Acetoacetyl-CoA synthetase like protein [Argiope bruennichi]|uniref:Acetoacetyl-CoA synthetase like protein n=1 Tax=Argiope bruennichi TaxID=94029 RepID=A0A8T0EC23_ARGBR|nr:Acetoacetyl-CoA synthetase like protein [Argiope bruennichi]
MNPNNQNFENAQMMWKPIGIDHRKKRKKFLSILEEKYGAKFGDYWDFHKWSVEHLEEFWAEIWDFAGIIYSQTFEKVIDLSIPMSDRPNWFEGAKLNFAENLLRNRDDRIALIMTGEDRETKKMTYNEVYEIAQLYASAFRKFGIKKGDRIACFMSNREEPIFAMLGAASIGAIWTGALPFIGAEAALNRFKLVAPRIMITVDRFRNNGAEIEMLHKVQKIAAELECLEKVIIVPSKEESKLKDISGIKNSCFLDDFLQLGVEEDGSVPPIVFEQLPLSHPLFISYTSGTTGLPKPLVHGSGGLIEVAKVHYLNREPKTGQSYLSMSPVGWASWNMTSAYLFTGITVILYEGVPYFLSPTYLWDLIDKFQLSTLFLSPSVLDELEKRNYVPTEKHNKKECHFLLWLRFNRINGSMHGIRSNVTHIRGEIPCPTLGFDLDCLDDSGNSVLGEIGELVIKKPAPSLPLGLWGDTDGSRFRETYFSKYQDVFALGDLGIINPVTRGIIICCRSDETLKPRGVRFGSSEIYNIVNLFPEIRDSLCVSQYSKSNNERAVLFVQMKKGYSFNEELVEIIRLEIKNGLSDGHVPELILETNDIPHCAVEDSTRTLSYSCMRSSVNDFISTEEKSRKILTPSRSLLYTLHLDLPKGREHYLKEAAGSFSSNFRIPHIGKIHFGSGFYFGIISGLIYHAVNFAGQRCKTFNWLSKFKVIKESEFHRLHPIIVNDFLNDLPFFNMDPTELKEFFTKFCFKPWIFQYENAEVLEYFLHHASFFGRDFEKDRPSNYDLTDACISKGFFLNIAPILKCLDAPRLSSSYGAYLFIPEYIRRGLTEEALTQAGSWMTKERKKLILQLLVIYLKAYRMADASHPHFKPCIYSGIPFQLLSYLTMKSL